MSPGVLWIPPPQGRHIPLPCCSGPRAGESTISVTDNKLKLKIKSQLAMLGKGAGPSKMDQINSRHRTKAGKLSTASVVGTSQRQAVWE
jgi:hypothetical protein